MANSQMKIDLIFQANTQAALNNIQQLNNLLHQIGTKTTIGIDGGSLSTAVQSAQQLQGALAQATNVDTGKIDLTKLNNSLKQSGTSLKTLSSNLLMLGPQGEQAFVKLANAIGRAETPMFQLNQRLKNFGTTLLNTVKWQMASTMIHGIQGAIQGAISHAEKLNGALNDIRIVTGKSITDMSKFTQTANEAARALNSTTTEYAEAALIFYQQGLDGKAVEERAETVLKLAQVTGQSAEVVSNQMTAVWNNFYDGSKSLEYYADVVTALGAATASSSDEIIQGLEKFAATADTIGLSYEYASASLATVVAETRQAPEVVGNAFKTLFARLQGLSLGETLEDGTDLNKYSEALQAVGVNIKDQSGNLKDAQVILQETSKAWEKLGKDEQVALAQTVGGMRQYTQFMALMENWDKVELNVDIAELSEGTLTKQQKTWSESWEAANKRVEQSKNELYQQIIDDKMVIGLKDIWSDIIDTVGTFIDKMGGIVPVVGMLVGVFSKQLFPMISNGFTRLKNNLAILTGSASKQILAMQNDVRADIQAAVSSNLYTDSTKQQLLVSDKLIQARQQLALSAKNMSEAERAAAERKMAIIEQTANEIQKSLELQAEWEKEIELLEKKTTQGEYKQEAAKNMIEEQYGEQTEEDFQKEYGITKDQMAERAAKGPKAKSRLKYFEEEISSIDQDIAVKNEEIEKQHKKEKLPTKNLEQKQKEATEELIKKRQQLQQEYEEEKKALEAIANIQEKMANQAPKELSVGKTEAGFTVENSAEIMGVSEETHGYIKQMQVATAEKMGKDNSPVALEEQSSTGIIADASLGNLERAYQLQGEYHAAAERSASVQFDLENATSKTSEAVKKLGKDYKDVKTAFQQYNAMKGKMKTPAQTKEFKQLSQELTKLSQSYKKSKSAILSFADTANLSKEEVKELEAAFEKLDDLETAEAGMQQIDNVLKHLVPAFENAENGAEELALALYDTLQGKNVDPQKLEALRQKYEDLGREAGKTKGAIDGFNGKVSEGLTGPQAFAQKLGGMTQGMSQVAGGVMMLQGAFSTLASAFDEGNTPMKNFTNYLMGITTLIPAVTSIMQGFAAVKSAITKKELADDKKKQASDLGTAATGALKGSIQTWGFWGIALGAVLALAIIGGAIAAVASAKKPSADEEKEAELSANIEQLTADLNAAKEAAEGFKDAVSNYDEGVSALKKLSEGTNEYSEALEAANEKARELIKTYGLTKDDYYLSNTGLIEFYDGVLEKKQAQLNHIVNATEVALLMQKSELAEVQGKNDVSDDEQPSKFEKTDGSGTVTFSKDDKFNLGEMISSNELNKDTDTKAELTNDEIKDNVLNKIAEVYGKESELYNKVAETGSDAITAMVDWSNSLTEISDAQSEYAKEILGIISSEKYGAIVKELAGGDAAKATQLEAIAAKINENNTNTAAAGITEKVNTELDAIDYSGYDEFKNGELDQIEKMAEAGGIDLRSDAGESALLGEGVTTTIKWGEIRDTADLAKWYYESQGYTGVTANNDAIGDIKISWENDPNGGGPNENTSMNNEDITRKAANFIAGATTTYAISEESMSEDDMENKLRALSNASSSNAYGADFLGALGSAAANNTKALDFSNTYIDLTPEEVKEIQSMANVNSENYDPKALAKIMGLDETMVKELGYNTIDEFATYVNQAFNSYGSKEGKQKMDESGLAKATGLGFDEKTFKNYRDALAATNKDLANNRGLLNQVAVANLRLDRGVKGLADNWDDLSEKMNSGNLADQAEAAASMEEYVQDIVNLSDEEWKLLPDNFVQNNWDLIQQVVNGVPGAAQEMRRIANAEKVLFNIDTALDPDNTLKDDVQNLHQWFTNYDFGSIQPGVEIQDEFFYQQLEAISLATKMTEKELQDYLASWDLEAKIVEVKDSKGNIIGYKVESNSAVKSKSSWNNYSNSVASASARSGAQGDSSPAEKVERTKKSDIVERFKETEDVLDDIEDSMKRVNKQMDRLYGPSRIKAMEEEISLLEDEAEVLEQQRKENEKYLKEDQKALEKAAKEAGVRFNIDANGNITNYTEEMTRLYDQLAQAEEKMSKMSTKEEQDAYQKNVIDPLMDRINSVSDAAEAWSESVEKDEELLQKIEENLYERQDKEFEKLQYEVEFKIELNEEDLAIINYYFEKYADDIYTAAEQAATFGDKIQNTLEKGKIYEDQLVALNEKYKQGLISDADYAESLGEIQGNLIEVNEELLQHQEDLEKFYGETLQLAMEEIEKYTDKFENMIGVLDHYRTVMDLMGKSSDYKMIDKVLENKQTILNNKLSTSKETYNMLLEQEQSLLDQLNNSNITEAERKRIEADLEATRAEINETYDLMLSDAEAAMENLAEILANNIEKANKQLEDVLTGGRSFDALTTTAKRLQGSQEEYLTTTNKIYETTKMLRNIQNEIDKTTNITAKQKLKAFQQQTQLLQNQSKLSQFELNIQQKKYDLLLAEIALEEAQNAKSTVRLQRDSEGNFGYVYTANQESVSNAQQSVDDANNALYNARLEGANNYALQYQETMSSLYNDLSVLQEARKSGEIATEEEYERRKLEIIEYYSDKLTTASDLYSFAIAEDAKIAEEAWSSSLEIMDISNETWIEAVEDYLDTTEDYFEDFQNNIEDIAEDYGLTMEDMCESSNKMAKTSTDLANTINTEVLGAIANELYGVQTLVSYMSKVWGPTMDNTIEKYETLFTAIENAKSALATLDAVAAKKPTFSDKANMSIGEINTIINEFNNWLSGIKNMGNVAPIPETKADVPSTTENTNTGTARDKLTRDEQRLHGSKVKFSIGDAVILTKDSADAHSITNDYGNSVIGGFNDDLSPQTRFFDFDSYTNSAYYGKGYTIAGVKEDSLGQQYVQLRVSDNRFGYGEQRTTYWYPASMFKVDSYDTGGYTGKWGPEGKLAILHQKELVLNASQTEDLLMTMELLDSILKQIDLTTTINKINSLSNSVNNSISGLYKDTLQQDVHIEANFPNVTDRNEIQEAFNTLINEASQYVNRF